MSLSLIGDLLKINQWSYQWKMLFNPDTSKHCVFILLCSKQAQEIIFSRKKKTNSGTIFFNKLPIVKENIQKHWDLFFGTHQWNNLERK